MSHPDEPEKPDASSYPAEPSPADPSPVDPSEADPSPVDPERGLRGVMSAILILEAIAILLGLTVLANGGTSAHGWQIGVVLAVALAHILAPAVVMRSFGFPLVLVLQAILIGCWAIHAAIGITGVVFLVVWLLIWYMRREFRRRMAHGSGTGTMA
jgi:hypothetical protein